MNAVPFDTLKLARRLRAIGFPEAQADGVADAMADVMTGSDLATKADIGDLRSEMALLRTELKAGIAAVDQRVVGLRIEVKADIAAVDQRLAGFRTKLKGDNEVLRRDLTIRLGSLIVVAVGVLLAGMHLMQLHP
jgi:hypothetical protein